MKPFQKADVRYSFLKFVLTQLNFLYCSSSFFWFYSILTLNHNTAVYKNTLVFNHDDFFKRKRTMPFRYKQIATEIKLLEQ